MSASLKLFPLAAEPERVQLHRIQKLSLRRHEGVVIFAESPCILHPAHAHGHPIPAGQLLYPANRLFPAFLRPVRMHGKPGQTHLRQQEQICPLLCQQIHICLHQLQIRFFIFPL